MTMTNAEIVADKLLRQWNDRDLTAIDEYMAEDHIDHNPMRNQARGSAGVRALIGAFLERGDVRCDILTSFGEDELVATRYTLTITHKGDFMGVPAAGKTTVSHIVQIDRVVDGKIIETWGESNRHAVIEELGVVAGLAGPTSA